jgi:hypothetical protein
MTFHRSPFTALGWAAALLIASVGAQAGTWAEPVSQHPAMVPAQVLPGIDARVYLIGHPASPTSRGNPLNHRDHPAVAVARRARAGDGPLDPNTFIVQPPASTHWTQGPAPSAAALASLGD